MPVPKKRYPKARQGMRRSHHALTAPSLVPCPQCHTPRRAHHACPSCGTYQGREVIKVKPGGKK
ncbi:50S ribosomal protein L32 [Chloroflexota bacterium]